MTETTALTVPELVLRLEKPDVLQEFLWRAYEIFGMDTRSSREGVLARLYERALDLFRKDVEDCKEIYEKSERVYNRVRTAVSETEKELRSLEARLGKPVEVDLKRLGNDGGTRTLSGAQELEAFMDDLRADLVLASSEDPSTFVEKYGLASKEGYGAATPETYVRSGEAVLGELEDALVGLKKAEAFVGQKRDILQKLRDGRDRSFNDSVNAGMRYEEAKGMLLLLETDGLRRALVIRAEENAGRLDVGIDTLLELQSRLAPAEAGARAALADYTPRIRSLEDYARIIDATVEELADGKNNE